MEVVVVYLANGEEKKKKKKKILFDGFNLNRIFSLQRTAFGFGSPKPSVLIRLTPSCWNPFLLAIHSLSATAQRYGAYLTRFGEKFTT